MAKNLKPFIMLERDIEEQWFWDSDEPYDKRSAYVYLRFRAFYQEQNINVKKTGRMFTVCKGSFLTSIEKLAKKWHWSKGKVKRFMSDLIDANMIRMTVYTYGTLVTLINTNDFGYRRPTDDTNDDTDDDTENRYADRPLDRPADVTSGRSLNKKDKKRISNNNVKNQKNAPRGDFVWGVPEE